MSQDKAGLLTVAFKYNMIFHFINILPKIVDTFIVLQGQKSTPQKFCPAFEAYFIL